MIVANAVPDLLLCRIQGMDGRFLIYFDITSKQALNILYEERKMKIEDLNTNAKIYALGIYYLGML